MIPPTSRWRILTAISLGGALVSLAIACGDDASVTSDPIPDGAPPDASTSDVAQADSPATETGIEAFCKNTLGLYAPRYEECCDPTVAPKQNTFDRGLLAALLPFCTTSLGKSVESGRVTFVPAAAATCEANVRAEIDARTCPEVLHTPSNQEPKSIFKDAAGCSEMLVGRQPADAPCANDYECLDGLTCIGWTSTTDGTCKAPPGEGALCGYALPDGGGFIELVRWGFGTHPRCAAGFYCQSTALQQGTCQPSKIAGETCGSDDECADGLRCHVGQCGTGQPVPAGAPCERKSDCQDRLYCKSVDGGRVCAPRGVAGTPCTSALGSECEGACVIPDGGGGGSCVSYCGSQ